MHNDRPDTTTVMNGPGRQGVRKFMCRSVLHGTVATSGHLNQERVKAMQLCIRQATADDAELIGTMVVKLLATLRGESVEQEPYLAAAKRLIGTDNRVVALLALDNNLCIGAITLNEATAIYNLGNFGIISEFFVDPDSRSKSVGRQLLMAAQTYARERGWSKLEVGAPNVPRWQRTVDFYKANGFVEVGPRLGLQIDH